MKIFEKSAQDSTALAPMVSAQTDVIEFHDSKIDVVVSAEFHIPIPVQSSVHIFRSRVGAG